jgi:hypothetical protein
MKRSRRIAPSWSLAVRLSTIVCGAYWVRMRATFSTTRNAKLRIFTLAPDAVSKMGEALKYLREKAALEAVPGVRIVVGETLTTDDKAFPTTETIDRPVLLFDPSGARKDNWNERGLKKSGPYDQRTFSPKKLRIAVVCQARHEGRVDAFMAISGRHAECAHRKEQGTALRRWLPAPLLPG